MEAGKCCSADPDADAADAVWEVVPERAGLGIPSAASGEDTDSSRSSEDMAVELDAFARASPAIEAQVQKGTKATNAGLDENGLRCSTMRERD